MTHHKANNFLNVPLRAEVEEKLRVRAWKDEAFRQELLTNPKAVIEREYPQCFEGGKVPEEVTYKVIEEDSLTHYIILPTLPDKFATSDMPSGRMEELVANMTCIDITYNPTLSACNPTANRVGCITTLRCVGTVAATQPACDPRC